MVPEHDNFRMIPMPKTANHAACANRAVRPLNADEKLAVAVLVNLGRPADELARELGIAVAKVELWAKEFRDAKAKGGRALFKADKGAVMPDPDADSIPPVPMTPEERYAWLKEINERLRVENILHRRFADFVEKNR